MCVCVIHIFSCSNHYYRSLEQRNFNFYSNCPRGMFDLWVRPFFSVCSVAVLLMIQSLIPDERQFQFVKKAFALSSFSVFCLFLIDFLHAICVLFSHAPCGTTNRFFYCIYSNCELPLRSITSEINRKEEEKIVFVVVVWRRLSHRLIDFDFIVSWDTLMVF